MDFVLSNILIGSLLFVSMLIAGEVGRRLALRRARSDPEGPWQGVGVLDGAVFAMLGLIIAFSFSGAVTRFDQRRSLVVEETNAVGTAYLRLDLLAAEDQPALRADFRAYLDSRIKFYRVIADMAAAEAENQNGQRLQGEIWRKALAATKGSQPATMLLLPALNDMFDIASTRTMATRVHPPNVIFAMLFGLAAIAAGLAGYAMARSASRNWLHATAFAIVVAVVFYIIMDLEFPRLGLIRVDAFDDALVAMRAAMQ